MNERIKLLADQAKQSALDAMIKITDKEQALKVYSESYDTEFAELIVRECAGLFPNVYVEIETEYGHTPVVAADYIKKHFGVER